MDPFDTLGLPRRFALDPTAIDARVRELQRVLHPDKHATSSPADRRAAMARAVTVNEAARVLRDDLSRANAILRAKGVDTTADADPALLMEVMELRESLGEAKAARDPAKLAALGAEVQRLSDQAMATIGSVLDGEGEPSAALAPLVRLRYYRRFLDEHALATETLEG